MGQYFELFAETNNGFEHAEHNFEDFGGMKLMEHSYLGNNSSTFLQSKLANEWRGCKIYHIGDYADMEYPEAKNVYRKEGMNPQRYVANLDKKVFIDTWKTIPDSWGFRIDPVLLLTALGNGRGGGDYHSDFNVYTIGTWAGDRLSASNDINDYKDLEEIYPIYIEEKEFFGLDYDDEVYDNYLSITNEVLHLTPNKVLEQFVEKDNVEETLRDLVSKELSSRKIEGE